MSDRGSFHINIFLSYSRGHNKETAEQITSYLQWEKGHQWTIISDGYYDSYQQAIDNADLVIICYSEKYAEFEIKEADYADEQQKNMLVIYLEEKPNLVGLPATILSNAKHTLLLQDYPDLEVCTENVVNRITQIFTSVRLRLVKVPEMPKWYCPRSKMLNTVIVERFRWLFSSTLDGGGVLLISGHNGTGKTTAMAGLIRDPSNQDKLMKQCGVHTVFWMNCHRWRDNSAFIEGRDYETVGDTFQAEFEKQLRQTNGYTIPDLSIFDDVYHVALIEVIGRLAFANCMKVCIITCSNKLTQMSVDRRFRRFFDRTDNIQHVQYPVFSDQELAALIQTTVLAGANKANTVFSQHQLHKVAMKCNGLAREAVYYGHRLRIVTPKMTSCEIDEIIDKLLKEPKPVDATMTYLEKWISRSKGPLPIFVGMPNFHGYCARQDGEMKIIEGIRRLKQPASKGFFVVTGQCGIGKTTLVSATLQNAAYHAEILCDCNIQLIIWLNCSCYNTESNHIPPEVMNTLNLEAMTPQVSEAVRWANLARIVRHYHDTVKQRILFVFDNVCATSTLFALRQNCPNGLFLVIMRQLGENDLASITGNCFEIGPMSNSEIVEMLQTKYAMKDKLLSQHLHELASRFCYGSPLIACLVAAQFYRRQSYHQRFEEILKCEMFANAPDQYHLVKKLFCQSFEMLSETVQKTFLAILLYRPDDPVTRGNLAIVMSRSRDQLNVDLETLEEVALIRRSTLNRGHPCHVHPLIYDCAVHKISEMQHKAAGSADKFKIELPITARPRDDLLQILSTLIEKCPKKLQLHESRCRAALSAAIKEGGQVNVRDFITKCTEVDLGPNSLSDADKINTKS